MFRSFVNAEPKKGSSGRRGPYYCNNPNCALSWFINGDSDRCPQCGAKGYTKEELDEYYRKSSRRMTAGQASTEEKNKVQ